MIAATTTLPAKRTKEYYTHRDTGCEYSRTCLTCPRPVCKHDDRYLEQRDQEEEITQAYDDACKNMNPERVAKHIARQYGYSGGRQILRIVQRVRERLT